jgi:hypothetical protein
MIGIPEISGNKDPERREKNPIRLEYHHHECTLRNNATFLHS